MVPARAFERAGTPCHFCRPGPWAPGPADLEARSFLHDASRERIQFLEVSDRSRNQTLDDHDEEVAVAAMAIAPETYGSLRSLQHLCVVRDYKPTPRNFFVIRIAIAAGA
jgi:hypothetical protein